MAQIKFSRDEFNEMCTNHNLDRLQHTSFNDADSSAEEDFKDLDAAYYDLKPNGDEDSVAPALASGQDFKESVTKKKRKKKSKTASAENLAHGTNKEPSIKLSASTSQEKINDNAIVKKKKKKGKTVAEEATYFENKDNANDEMMKDESIAAGLEFTYLRNEVPLEKFTGSINHTEAKTIFVEMQFAPTISGIRIQDVINHEIERITPGLQFHESVQEYYSSLNRTQHEQDNAGTSNNGFTHEQLEFMFLRVVANQNAIKKLIINHLMQNHSYEATETNVKQLNDLEEIVNQISSLMHSNKGEIKQQINEQVAQLSKELKASQDALKDQMKQLSSNLKQNSNDIKQSIISVKAKNGKADLVNQAVQLLRNLTDKVDKHLINYNGEASRLIERGNSTHNFSYIDDLCRIQGEIDEVRLEQRKSRGKENRSFNNPQVPTNFTFWLCYIRDREHQRALLIREEHLRRLEDEKGLTKGTADGSLWRKLVPFRLYLNAAAFLTLVAMHFGCKWYGGLEMSNQLREEFFEDFFF